MRGPALKARAACGLLGSLHACFLLLLFLAVATHLSPGTAGAQSASYVLSANDQVQIDVFQEDDLRANVKISQDGTIEFPLLGQVRIGGLTIGQAISRITEMLRKDYLVNPRVTLTVQGFAKKRFNVFGQVNSPGVKEMPDQESIDLLDAIALSGGYTRIANPGNITIKRRVNGKEEVFRINGKAMAKGEVPSFKVLAGDTITVAESLF